MRLFRRILAAAGLAGLAAVLLGLRGRGGRPPSGDGWRELDLTDSDPGSASGSGDPA